MSFDMKIIISRILTLVLAVVAVAMVSSCKPEDSKQDGFDGKYYHDLPGDDWEAAVLTRADAMLHCPWTPVADVNSSGAKFIFPAGQSVEPIPYGGTGETDRFYTYVGINVSFYTFLSCVNNPKSNFYDTSLRSLYNRPFYGTVCTAMTSYCWGAPSSFNTWDAYKEIVPYLKRFSITSVEDLKLTDGACWYKSSIGGHILIITDIARDANGKMQKITTTEASEGKVHAETYTVEEFQAKLDRISGNIKQEGVKYFRYDRENYGKYLVQPAFAEQSRVSGYTFPDALCGNRGDKVSYPKDTAVVINILSGDYKNIELYKDEALYDIRALDETNDVIYKSLPVGMYKACLADASRKSSFTYFQVGETAFTATQQNGKVIIKYNAPDSEIQYITINTTNNTGSVCRYVERVKNGEYVFSWPLYGATNIRVHFAGKYSTYRGPSKKL